MAYIMNIIKLFVKNILGDYTDKIYIRNNDITDTNVTNVTNDTNDTNDTLQNDNILSYNQILKTPKKTPSFPLNPPVDYEGLNENETCKICLINKIRTINLECGHLVFCFKCSKDFILKNMQHKCPLCREYITKIKML